MWQAEGAAPSDFVLINGVAQFTKPELAGMLAAGELRALATDAPTSGLWPRVWSLMEDDGDVSDGTDVWWLAAQCGVEQLVAAPKSDLADEALDEWLKFFARG